MFERLPEITRDNYFAFLDAMPQETRIIDGKGWEQLQQTNVWLANAIVTFLESVGKGLDQEVTKNVMVDGLVAILTVLWLVERVLETKSTGRQPGGAEVMFEHLPKISAEHIDWHDTEVRRIFTGSPGASVSDLFELEQLQQANPWLRKGIEAVLMPIGGGLDEEAKANVKVDSLVALLLVLRLVGRALETGSPGGNGT